MFQKMALFTVAILFALNMLSAADDIKVCMSELGCVEGTYLPGYQTDKFEAFLGVPFAEPPVGSLRFKNPQRIKPWTESLEAKVPKSDCLQKNYLFDSRPISGEEDCLYLNVYRPIQRSSVPLPVMFYLYAGGFMFGSSSPNMLDPAYIMDSESVIVVTSNYRLGPFGFLSTGTSEMPGNLGFKDQQLALKWVQNNIQDFGGDPQAVTIFGHSAGASSVHLHILSESSNGLFQKAILASGNALSNYAQIIKEPRRQALKIANGVNIENAEALKDQELLEALQEVDAIDLLNASDSLISWHNFPLFNYRPTIEQPNWTEPFLTAAPADIIKNGHFEQVPWLQTMVGSRGEGSLFTLNIWTHEELLDEFNEDFEERLWEHIDLPFYVTTEKKHDLLDLLITEYFAGERKVNNHTLNGFSELFGDLEIYYPVWKTVKHFLSYAKPNIPLFIAKFNYHGPYTRAFLFADGRPIDYGTAVHLDDIDYLFRAPAIFPNGFRKDSTDARLVREMVDLYLDFVRNDNVRGVDACTENSFNANSDFGICEYLEIHKHVGNGYERTTHNEFNVKRMRLWDNILDENL